MPWPWVPDLIRHWLLPNDFASPDAYVDFWYACIPDHLRDAMELPA